jgi:hypothetical protein
MEALGFCTMAYPFSSSPVSIPGLVVAATGPARVRSPRRQRGQNPRLLKALA